VHLRTHSAYSLLEGAVQIPQLIKACKAQKIPAVALTDSGNLFGALEFSMEASKHGVQPINGGIFNFDPGEEFRVRHFETGSDGRSKRDNKSYFDRILLLAKDQTGYRNLLKLASSYYLENGRGQEHLNFAQLAQNCEGLIALTCGVEGTVGKLILSGRHVDAERFLLKLSAALPDHLYLELMRHGLPDEEATEGAFVDLGLKHNIPFVATNDVYFLEPNMYRAHEILLCIADGKYIQEDDRRKVTPEHYFKSSAQMIELFSDIPEAIENTTIIARRCSVKAESRDVAFPHYHTTRASSYDDELKILAMEGLEMRLANVSYEVDRQVYLDRLNYELEMIIKMSFASYILIVADFVRWAKENGIPVGPGRGSGAGCIVNWCMGITDPDPIYFGLIFERFLNPERASLPDVDIDFCQDRRHEVVKYVRDKYGEKRVAHIITFGKLQARAVLRDVGRVLQLPYNVVDRIAKLVPFNAISPVTLSQALEIEPELRRIRDQDENMAELIDISLKLEGLYRHVSIHAAGIVIADQDLVELVPLYKDDKSDLLVIQYSMKYAEAAGLIKFDFLGVKTLTMLANCEKLIQQSNSKFRMINLGFDDEQTFKMLSAGSSVGVFQIESDRMQSALSHMLPDSIEDIIALGALNRPGPMNSIATYIDCKRGRAMPDYLHPKLERVLKKTFGILIYQEQVIEAAQLLAGYTAGAADLLRRAMGKKIKAEMDAQKEIFIKGATDRDIDPDQAAHIFNLIEKFAGYGFNRSHAVAYGIISYYTAYLKANYTAEFLVSIMNIELSDTDKIYSFIQEAKNFNIGIVSPDINCSDPLFSVQNQNGDKVIVYGLGAIRNISFQAMQTIVEERRKHGMYKDVFDFMSRVDAKVLSKRQLEYLIKAGAFDKLHANRKQLFDSIDRLFDYHNLRKEEESMLQLKLFSDDELSTLPTLVATQDWDNSERLSNECDSFGFYLIHHPLDIYKDYFDKIELRGAQHIKNAFHSGTFRTKIAAIPISLSVKLSAKGRYMTCIMSTHTGMLRMAIFDEEVLKNSRDLLYTKAPVVLDSEVIKDGSSERIVIRAVYDLKSYLDKFEPTIVIHVNDSSALEHVKRTLQTEVGARTKILLNVTQGGKRVKMELPPNTTCDLSRLALANGAIMIETIV
jgi:DNA polymerase-3 subunit alpha